MRNLRSGWSRWAGLAAILIITLASSALSNQKPDAAPVAAKPDPTDPNRYLNAVREFADNVPKYGRDTYGPKHTPLFVDGLNIHTHEPVKWIAPNDDRWILSNWQANRTFSAPWTASRESRATPSTSRLRWMRSSTRLRTCAVRTGCCIGALARHMTYRETRHSVGR